MDDNAGLRHDFGYGCDVDTDEIRPQVASGSIHDVASMRVSREPEEYEQGDLNAAIDALTCPYCKCDGSIPPEAKFYKFVEADCLPLGRDAKSRSPDQLHSFRSRSDAMREDQDWRPLRSSVGGSQSTQ
eukprot:2299184-Amphidinium_carterae.1